MNMRSFLCACFALLIFAVSVSSSVAFASETNLASDKSYTVTYDSPIENAYPECAYEAENKLTDGILASEASYSDPAFLELYRGTAVSVTIDLGEVNAVSSVELRTLQIKSAGIYCARYVYVAVSENGTDFGTVGTLDDGKSITSDAKQIVIHTVPLDQTYLARYVRVTFSSDVNTYVDEISVYGSKASAGAVSAEADVPQEDRGFSSEIDGIGNIVLMYTVGKYTEETLRPYLAYVDTAGDAKDIMFDSMLFLPSPASGYDFTKKTTWDSYTGEMFGTEHKINLSALNSLVGRMREELGLADDYRYPVFLAIPFLEIGNSSFDGTLPNTLENRLKIISAYVDELVNTFNSSDFTNLELKGLYWFQESVTYTISEQEEELIIRFNEYAHSKNLKTIWIPYYCAPGFERAIELGFDSATLQSGYAFPRSGESLSTLGEVLPEAVEDSAAQAKKYGLGMEFEIDLNASDAHERFYKYLHTGYATGCMNGHMMMLYQGVDAFYKCANSTVGSDLRDIYDLTYLYNKGKFTSKAPTVESGQVVVAQIGTRASGTIVITDEDSLKSDLKIFDSVVSEGLTYVLEGDGFYILNTSKSSAGLYTVSFKVSDGYNLSESATVKFLLKDPNSPGESRTLDSELILYSSLDKSSTSTSIPAGMLINVLDVGDGWSYVSATVNGEVMEGFTETSSFRFRESPEPADEPNSNTLVPVIAISVTALLAIAAIFILVLKKQKNKG